MVKPAPGKLVLISDSRRDAAWVERSGHAPALVVHSNDDLPAATGPVVPPLDSDVRLAGKLARDTYVTRAVALSVGVHLALAAAIFWLMPGAPSAPPLATVEMVFAKVESDVVVEAQGKPVPEQVAETQVTEAPPPAPEPPLPEPPPPEPEPPPSVAEAPPEAEPPPPPEPDPIPEIVMAPEPPPPPPPEVKVEKPPEPKVEPRPRPPQPKPIKLTEPRPVPVIAAPPAEIAREDAAPSKVDTGQSAKTPEIAAAPMVNDDKLPQEAAAPVVNTAPAISALKFRNNTKPTYPSRARDMNIEGTVLLEVWIDVEGNPTNVIVIQSSGSPLLDEAAKRGAWRWTFWPYTVNGRAEPRSAHVPVPFKLNN